MATARKRNGNGGNGKDKPCEEFVEIQRLVSDYHSIGQDDPMALDFLTVFAMGTWTFSEGSPQRPYTYPYANIAGDYGSGKSLLGRNLIGAVCRRPEKIVETTGPALCRLIGDFDPETGDVVSNYPTLLLDEVDATFNGPKNETLRAILNEGYEQGATIPRTMGKTGSVRFPVYCPKILMGKDNGNLPDSVVSRAIRLDLVSHPSDELESMGIQEMFVWDTADRIADLCDLLADWGKRNAMILREYNPERIPGLTARQWSISRSIVQLAKAAGVENRIRAALTDLFSRAPKQIDMRVRLYSAIAEAFEEAGSNKVTNRRILAKLLEHGIPVAGGSTTGLGHLLGRDGISPRAIWIDDPNHPDYKPGKAGKGQTHRGYHRSQFADMFARYMDSRADEAMEDDE